MRRVLVCAVLLAGCPSEEEVPIVANGPALPELSDVDLPAAFAEGIEAVFAADLRGAWAGHRASLDAARPGCPDFWVGEQDVNWQDACTTGAGVVWSGELGWNAALSIEGEADSAVGITSIGSRLLEGAALVADESGERFGFSGVGVDSVYASAAPGYVQWRYQSSVSGRVRGSDAVPGTGRGGMLLDLDLAYSGGAVSELTARGDLHTPDARIAGLFDSVSLDVELAGPGAALPDDCVEEPKGWIGLRDENAYWYDLVLQPRFTDDATGDPWPNEPYSRCEGCGMLYVRGVPTEEVCVDFAALFDGRLQPPDVEDYVLPVRGVMDGG